MTILIVVTLILLAAALAPIAGVDSREREPRRWPEPGSAQSGAGV